MCNQVRKPSGAAAAGTESSSAPRPTILARCHSPPLRAHVNSKVKRHCPSVLLVPFFFRVTPHVLSTAWLNCGWLRLYRRRLRVVTARWRWPPPWWRRRPPRRRPRTQLKLPLPRPLLAAQVSQGLRPARGYVHAGRGREAKRTHGTLQRRRLLGRGGARFEPVAGALVAAVPAETARPQSTSTAARSRCRRRPARNSKKTRIIEKKIWLQVVPCF